MSFLKGIMNRVGLQDIIFTLAGPDDIKNERVQALFGCIAECHAKCNGNIILGYDARALGIIHIVMNIGNLIGDTNHPSLQRRRRGLQLMIDDAIPHLPGEVQALPAVLQPVHNAQTLFIVPEAARHDGIQRPLTGVPVGCMPEIMTERDGLDKVVVKPECSPDRARDLRDLERMGQARAIMVSLRIQKDLCLILQPPECLAVNDPVSVAHIFGAYFIQILLFLTSPRMAAQRSIRTQQPLIILFNLLSYIHSVTSVQSCCCSQCSHFCV